MPELKLDIIAVLAIVEFVIIGIGGIIFKYIYDNLKSKNETSETKFTKLETEFDTKNAEFSKLLDTKIDDVTNTLQAGINSITQQLGTMVDKINNINMSIHSHHQDIESVKHNQKTLDEKLKENRLEVNLQIANLQTKIEHQDEKQSKKVAELGKELHEKINSIALDNARNHK